MSTKSAVILVYGCLVASGLRADPLACNLTRYKALPGLVAGIRAELGADGL